MAEQRAIIVYGDYREENILSNYVHTPHLASSLLDDGLYDTDALAEAMQRAIQVCLHMQVPVQHHFRHIYVQGYTGHEQDDWALSDFGLYLLLLNGQTQGSHVAYAQAYVIHRAFCRS